jgi:amino acid adenylation domain-containing protein
MNTPNVLDTFLEQVRHFGEKVAVIADDESVTYQELATRAAAVANYLAPRVTHEEVVGVFTTRSVDMLAAIIGIWQAGCAYLPMDANDPPQRALRILGIAECKVVLTHPELIANLETLCDDEPGHVKPLFVDVRGLRESDALVEPPFIRPDEKSLAYVMCTSGSSGEPKGVEIEHNSLHTFLHACRDLIGFNSEDCFLAVTTIGFDASLAELFIPLISGGAILLRSQDLLHSPERLAAEIRTHHVTVFQAVATIWALIVEEHAAFPHLRIAMNMGEAISNELAARLLPLADQVWNMYGPTEATVYACACRITREVLGVDPQPGLSAPIGRALNNATCLILDSQGHKVPVGERGELYIAGPAVARGYRHAPELTGRTFVQLQPEIGRAYRTGDVVALRDDGELLYFGRNDDQLKVRGQRVEPGEVRAALLGHPAVSQAAVTWFKKADETRSIVAAIVSTHGYAPDPEALRAWLNTRLRPPMVPECLLFPSELPRLPNKKIDNQQIRRDAMASRLISEPGETGNELTSTEKRLIEIWREILHIPSIKSHDHFLALGGDSLGAMQMLNRIEKEFGAALSIGTIFEHLQLDQLAAHIDGAGGRSPEEKFVFPLHQLENERPLFFSDADLRLASEGRWTVACPLFGLAHWAQDREYLRAQTLADHARSHVVAIRNIQPFGPYRLGGQDFGGIVALEIARQLELQGEEVEILFLLNPRKPGHIGSGTSQTSQKNLTSSVRRAAAWFRQNRLSNWINYQAHHIGRTRNTNPAAAKALPRSHWPALWGSERRLSNNYLAMPCAAPVMAYFVERGPAYDTWTALLGPEGHCQVLPASEDGIYSNSSRAIWMEALGSVIAASANSYSTGSTCPIQQ